MLTSYLVDCENLTPRQALEQFESSIALAVGSLTTDEQYEMAWKQEFGFGDEDEETTVDDHGYLPPPTTVAPYSAELLKSCVVVPRADAYAALIKMNSRRLSTVIAHDETPASTNSQTSVVPALSLGSTESEAGQPSSQDEDEVAFVVTPLTSAPPSATATGRAFRFDEAVKYKSLGITPAVSSSRSGSGECVKVYAGSKVRMDEENARFFRGNSGCFSQEFVLKTAVLARKSAERYSSVLSKFSDPEVKPEYSDVWRRGPQGCVVVFTPDTIMELVLKYQSTGNGYVQPVAALYQPFLIRLWRPSGLLEVTDRSVLKELLKAANDYDFPVNLSVFHVVSSGG